NPEMRSRYDESRRQPQSEAAASFSREDMPEARRQAADYPRDWNQFEDWLDVVAADFSHARYGKVSGGAWGASWPTTYGSVSGMFFIVGGGLAGVLIGLGLAALTFRSVPPPGTWRGIFLGGIFFACGGAWVGRWLREVMRDIMQPARPPPPRFRPAPATNESCIVRCPRCQQQLQLRTVLH